MRAQEFWVRFGFHASAQTRGPFLSKSEKSTYVTELVEGQSVREVSTLLLFFFFEWFVKSCQCLSGTSGLCLRDNKHVGLRPNTIPAHQRCAKSNILEKQKMLQCACQASRRRCLGLHCGHLRIFCTFTTAALKKQEREVQGL